MKAQIHLTYEQKRTCLECCAPLADQTHGLRKFCPRVKHEDGYIDHCKDRYNTRHKKKKGAAYKRLMAFYQEMTKRIEALAKNQGEVVSLEQLNRCGVQLERHLLRKATKDGRMIYYFVEHVVEAGADQTYKIYTHELF